MRFNALAAALVILFLSAVASAATLVSQGKSPYVIVIAEQPLPANQRAARELRRHLLEMSGAELPIQDDTAELPEHAILIGPSRHLDALGVKLDKEKLGNDGFVLKTIGARIVIAGPGPRGSMYGVSEVLEKLGVRWFTATVTRIPKNPTVELPPIDEMQVPAFEYREPFFTEAQDKDWAARNRVVGWKPRLDASTGGTITYAHWCHTLDLFVPPQLFETHPEYFPMIGGQRVGGRVQRCLTNPEVLKLAIAGVRKAFADNPHAVITSVSQNDVLKWCQCEQCAKLEQQFGAQSGVYLWFANQVAEAIEEEYPDKLIDTLAYLFTEAPPRPGSIAPRKNVRVRLCPLLVCQGHAYEKCGYVRNKAFVANLAAWHQIAGDTLYIWHYTTNFAHYLQPFPNFNEFPADARLYARSGVKGAFFQGAYQGPGGSDAELKSYVMAKVLWDPQVDSDKLVTEWMEGVYGRAAAPMRQWFDLLHQRAADPGRHFNCYAAPTISMFADDVLPRGDKLFDEAEKLAADDAVARHYVAKSRLWLRYVKLARKMPPPAERAAFVADCRKFGITHISERLTLDAWAMKIRGAPRQLKEWWAECK